MKGPRPHYLVEVESISPDGANLTGWVYFPSTDVTIGDRVDHVNVAHHLFAAWNAAHVMSERAGFEAPRAYETRVTARRETAPDRKIRLEVKATIKREHTDHVFGVLQATFSDNDLALCKVVSKFVARRRP